METLGALPDIPTFDGEPVPVSQNPLTSGTRPLQLLPLPGMEFPVIYKTSRMRGFQSEDLLDPPMRARVVAVGFGDYAAGLRRTQPRFPPAMRYALMEQWNDCTHTFVFEFGEMTLMPVNYAAITGLRFTGLVPPLDGRYQTATLGAQLVRSLLGVTTQTRYTAEGCVSYEVVYRFWAERIRTQLAAWRELPVEARPAAPAYTREERDQAARSFLFYIISSQLLCTSQNKGDPAVLACLRDLSQVWSYEYRIYLGGPSGDTPAESRRFLITWPIAPYLCQWRGSRLFLTPWDCDAWRAYPGREVAELHTRSRLLMRGYWVDRYFLGERVYDTPVAPAQRWVPHAPPRHMCLLEGLTREDLEVAHRGVSVNDFLSAGDFLAYFSSRMQARLPEILECTQEQKTHKTAAHYRAEAAAEAAAEAGAAVTPAGPVGVVLGDIPFPLGMEVVLDPGLCLGSGIIIPADLRQAPPPVQLDPKHTTHDLENGRLRRHQSRQSSAVSRLQAKVDQLRMRLEVEGIPLDSSDEDDDGSSDDAPLSPPP
ncbi:hypothetical protein JCGZ_10558 [Jatropha curcas]|uniref:Aminotransferase-like plant mobile domain-containing protein n=1 Tax=Jatropha curcas TaxID=180498 RepID=A0A067KIH1_JATCU|nr:hypothetical protein JCGZ_10558 [Jatropha curcas]